jgi:uncharacterized repeat protein (TIGR03806 family)
MKHIFISTIALIVLTIVACSRDNRFNIVEIPDFDFPQTTVFEQQLSAYQLFEGTSADLVPAADVHLLELSSILFTDYAHKQRLVKLPEGKEMTATSNETIDFPDGTILVKTFFYYQDERDTTLGKRIIETRLLIKESNTWNVATYLWNEAQTDATLELNGVDTPVSWMDANGSSRSTLYHIPDENECIACHQSNNSMTPLGPTLSNLNQLVARNGATVNQLTHFQQLGILNKFQVSQVSKMPDYTDSNIALMQRGRAYLAMNCAHCHQPTAWRASAERDFDFRYETPLNQTGIAREKDRIIDAILEGEMPFIGTTMLDEEGVRLMREFVEAL